MGGLNEKLLLKYISEISLKMDRLAFDIDNEIIKAQYERLSNIRSKLDEELIRTRKELDDSTSEHLEGFDDIKKG